MPEETLKKNIFLNFYDHPTTPCFVAKGENRNVVFEVPSSYYPEEYKKLTVEKKLTVKTVSLQSTSEVIKVPNIEFTDDLGIASSLDKRANFTLFNPFHQECAEIVIKNLMKIDSDKLLSYCTKLSLELNPYLFDYALSVALLHRQDTKTLPLPSAATYLPEFYLDSEAMKECTTQGSIVQNENLRKEILIAPAASDLDIENRIAYFREDIGLNLHHWHWHIIYPATGDKEIVGKDRRGELFYYMHQQALGRYNIERFCNRLHRTASLSYWREPIAEGYFPKLDTPFMRNKWATRPANTYIQDLSRPNMKEKITNMELWRDRILDAIHTGNYLNEKSEFLPFNKNKESREKEGYYDDGIDILGNLVEATSNSVNPKYYGNLHIQGHLFIAYCHDPDNRYLEGNGVIGDNKTAMRDPAFYRWHAFIDDLFQEYKCGLEPYTAEQLCFKDVRIEKLQIQSSKNELIGLDKKPNPNELYTFMQVDRLNVASGIDVKNAGSIYVKFSHLQHQNFDYKIEVHNNGSEKLATVRIFMAPTTDETNTPYDPEKSSFPLKERRRFFIELDKFVVKLNAKGHTTITRSSKDSSVTVPFKQMFMDVEELKRVTEYGGDNAGYESADLAFCGCGWPHHLLIPKGMVKGYPCHLFAMLTDYEQDKVPEDEPINIDDLYAPKSAECKCNKAVTAVSYCGLKNKKYPDKKPMGFPFDRLPEAKPGKRDVSLHDFVNPISNMEVADIIIYHKDLEIDGKNVRVSVQETDLYTM